MSRPLNYFFALALLAALVVAPAISDQSGGAVMIGSDHSAINIENKEVTYVKHADVSVDEDVYSPTIITVEAPISTQSSNIQYLGVGDVDFSRLLYDDEVLIYETEIGQKYDIRAGSYVAVYTIQKGNDALLLEDPASKMVYDKIYHRFEHGTVAPLWIYKGYTTKCHVNINADEYLVVDNRYSGDRTMIEVAVTPPVDNETTIPTP